MTRADFLKNSLNFSILTQINKFSKVDDFLQFNNPSDEEFWGELKKQFHIDNEIIDFRTYAASPLPNKILNSFIKEFTEIESSPSMKNKGIREGEKELLRLNLAKEINSSADEIAIFRNTTEALNNAIMGISLKKGDEVIASVHEYDSMMASLHQRKIKDGITIKTIDIPYQPKSKEQIIAIFESSITEKTKMFLISHIVWISGQIYPIKEICEIAKKHNITTIVDAAQSFSHIEINIKEIGCDYLGASLHKWCTAPLGTGFLYIKKELITKTYPLISSYKYLPDEDVIEKFENYGTVTPVFETANLSIQFWQKLGLDTKTKRMQELKEYWTEKLRGIQNVEIVTNCEKNNSCGIAYFKIKNKSALLISKQLWEKHKTNVEVIENYKNHYVDYKNVNVVGIATPVFAIKQDLDKLVDAVKSIK